MTPSDEAALAAYLTMPGTSHPNKSLADKVAWDASVLPLFKKMLEAAYAIDRPGEGRQELSDAECDRVFEACVIDFANWGDSDGDDVHSRPLIRAIHRALSSPASTKETP